MAKKKTKLEKAQESAKRAQKKAAVEKAELNSTNKLIDKGWMPK